MVYTDLLMGFERGNRYMVYLYNHEPILEKHQKCRSEFLAISSVTSILLPILMDTNFMSDIVSVAIRPARDVVLTPSAVRDAPQQSFLQANALRKWMRRYAQSSIRKMHP